MRVSGSGCSGIFAPPQEKRRKNTERYEVRKQVVFLRLVENYVVGSALGFECVFGKEGKIFNG